MFWTAMVLAAVLVRCVVGIAPQLYWDIDPRSPRWISSVMTFGPGGLAWLNSASLLVAAAALGAHVLAGGRVSRWSALLALTGAATCAVQMTRHADNLRLCGSWIAASALGLAALHLARHDGPRRLIVAALVALVVPWSLGAVWYVWVEHPLTVADHEANLDSILKSKHFVYGSTHHLLFEKRLRASDALGPFAISNVFGSLAAAMTVLTVVLGLGFAASRRRIATLPLLLTVAGLGTVALTRSKGAAVALGAVAAVLATAWLLRRYVAVRLGTVAVAVLVLTVSIVIARGAAGPPPTAEGERSLLFRSHYWGAAARILMHAEPHMVLTGVGPASFEQSYPHWKDELNPEQVKSSHNVLIDYVTMLGLGGAAWTLLLLGWLVAAGRRASRPPRGTRSLIDRDSNGPVSGRNGSPPDPPTAVARRGPAVALRGPSVTAADLGWALLVTVPVFATQYAFEHNQFDPPSLLRWMAGVGGFVFVTAALSGRAAGVLGPAPLGLFAAALLLLLHNQIEMTYFLDGSSALAWLVVGAAAAGGQMQGPPRRRGLILPVVMLLAAVAMAVCVAIPVTRQQGHLAAAAAGENGRDRRAAVWGLERAIAALPSDPKPYRTLAKLLLSEGRTQYAEAVLQRAADAGLDEIWRLRLLLEIARAEVENGSGTAPPWAGAVMAELLRRNRFNVHAHLSVADLTWRIGDRAKAAAFYRRVLKLSDNAYLDPSRQLSEQRRRHVMSRLNEADAGRAADEAIE